MLVKEIKKMDKNIYCILTDSGIYSIRYIECLKQYEFTTWENYTSRVKNARRIYKFDKRDFPTVECLVEHLSKVLK